MIFLKHNLKKFIIKTPISKASLYARHALHNNSTQTIQ